MSLSTDGRFFTAEDGEIIKLSFVAMVEPHQGNNGGTFYEVVMSGGGHFTVKETYYSRASFLTAWKAA